MMACEDSITLTLIGNHDFQLLLWNLADVELLRIRYRMICTYAGCLSSNPLQNLEHSLPAIVSFDQLLILLGIGGPNAAWSDSAEFSRKLKINLELLTPLRCNSLADFKDFRDLALALPKAPSPLLNMLSKIRCSSQYRVYEYLYFSPCNFYITSGTKFGGDFLLYYKDPAKCYSQHIVNVVDYKQPIKNRQLLNFGRLATGVGKTRILAATNSFQDGNQPSQVHVFTIEWSGLV